jgi:hypothetical protein
MEKDTAQLLKYSFITVLLIAAWFGLTSLSHSIVVESLLGWVGLIAIAFYWRWLIKNKIRGPKS